MKKLVSLIMMLVMMLAITPLESQAQASKSSIKAAKSRAKELKKAGWNCEGPQTLESAFIDIANKESQNLIIVTGSAYGRRSLRVAKMVADKDAISNMAKIYTEAGKGRIISTAQEENVGDSSISSSVIEISAELVPEGFSVKKKITIFRNDPRNGDWDCQIFYIISSDLE